MLDRPAPEPDLLSERRSQSLARLESLRSDLAATLPALDQVSLSPRLCIYATGSLARLEASSGSDLDAFFFLTGCEEKTPLGRIRDVKILNAVVEASERNGFPDFSNDGEYLKFLHIEDVIKHIGGREDDYHNALTARMLLILESKYLYNEGVFKQVRETIIEHYFADFHSHSRDFRPIFLLNDVLRFWRTICLNYENSRHWRLDDPEKRAKGHLANLKLRFSRLNICFSFIASLLSRGTALSPEDVISVSEMTPLERLHGLKQFSSSASSRIDRLFEEYRWFLAAVGGKKSDVLTWISDETSRTEAFSHSRAFIEDMYELVAEVANKNGFLRYLVI